MGQSRYVSSLVFFLDCGTCGQSDPLHFRVELIRPICQIRVIRKNKFLELAEADELWWADADELWRADADEPEIE